MSTRVLVVFGTRPEAIKVAPVIEAIRQSTDTEPVVAVTAQHREMLDQVLKIFDIEPEYDLDIMKAGQSLTDITVRAIEGLSAVIESAQPDAVLVQGDTTTTFTGALAGAYLGVPVFHLEAGYRTQDKHQPFPEEINRRLVSELADLHFAVNQRCSENLRAEGHAPETIHVVGNTGIDALQRTVANGGLPSDGRVAEILASGNRIVLMTTHRRENWGAPIEEACRAAQDLARAHQDIEILFAAHLNPIVQNAVRAILGGTERVHVLPAMDYASFCHVLARADLVLSDSGGIHEEALALSKPLLLLRNVTEWPEALASGAVHLVGTDRDRIVAASNGVLDALATGARLPHYHDPHADGHAAERVAHLVQEYFSRKR